MSAATQDVFELVLARPVVTAAGDHGALVHLWWRTTEALGERLVQVYVDGELADVTAEPTQREMWLLIDRAQGRRIELLAVDPAEAWRAQPESLVSWQPSVRSAAALALVRDEALPVDARVGVSVDGVLVDEAVLWAGQDHRGGFGALFGEGGFGIDAATGPGLGNGELGMGALGADGSAWRWRRDDLAIGTHALTVTAHDAGGQEAAPPHVLEDVAVDRLPEPTTTPTIDPDFTLRW